MGPSAQTESVCVCVCVCVCVWVMGMIICCCEVSAPERTETMSGACSPGQAVEGARMDSIHSCVETTQNPRLEGGWNQRPHNKPQDVPQMS